jgi:hypothetical protein
MLKLWGIRHFRYWWLKAKLIAWFSQYEGPGCFINPDDWAYLDGVWRGEQ